MWRSELAEGDWRRLAAGNKAEWQKGNKERRKKIQVKT